MKERDGMGGDRAHDGVDSGVPPRVGFIRRRLGQHFDDVAHPRFERGRDIGGRRSAAHAGVDPLALFPVILVLHTDLGGSQIDVHNVRLGIEPKKCVRGVHARACVRVCMRVRVCVCVCVCVCVFVLLCKRAL